MTRLNEALHSRVTSADAFVPKIICSRCEEPAAWELWQEQTIFRPQLNLRVEHHGRRELFVVDEYAVMAGRAPFPRRVFADERNPKTMPLSLLWGRHRRR